MKLKNAAVLAACIPLLTGCEQVLQSVTEVTLDSALLEETIENGILEQMELYVTAECPDSLGGQPGDVRQCMVTDEFGTNAFVDITIQNYEGDITWELRN
jgi:hypothetical protein